MQHNTPIAKPLLSNLRGFCLKLTGCEQDADDLMQDTMVRFYRSEYQESGYLKAYLFKIAINAHISKKRKQNNWGNMLEVGDATVGVCHNDGALELESCYIMEAVSNVPEMYRRPLLMYANGKKYEEIAEEMALPLGTVKARIFTARREARKFIKLINGTL